MITGLAQAGRLVAGDATYGITTPWHYGDRTAFFGGEPGAVTSAREAPMVVR